MLAVTGAVALDGYDVQDERQRGESTVGAQQGDTVEVTIHSVSDVDSFEGVEVATRSHFRASVAGLRRSTGCWEAESRSAARSLLEGKQVRLSVWETESTAEGRTTVNVVLPDGKDYAQTAVGDGVALADPVRRSELVATESVARREHRGLWSAPCAPGEPATTTSTTASSTTNTSTTGGASATETPSQAPPPLPPDPPSVTTTTARPPVDDVQRDVQVGAPCGPEGARGRTSRGEDVVCTRRGKDDQAKWRKTDDG